MKRRMAAPARGVLSTALGFSVLAALLVAHVAGRIGGIDQGLALSRLQARQEALSRENARLRLEVLTLRSPARLERLGEKLGMGPPAAAAVLREAGPGQVRARAAVPGAALAERP
ncbi:MAG TPA: cell division protein FtsL [Myxococcales bacterium]|jgi:cell division protein FtsL|nr:cell division protein FtsL [Myxococcales bacterium]